MAQPRTPAVVRRQIDLLCKAFVETRNDLVIEAHFVAVCHFLAQKMVAPYADGTDFLAACQQQDPSLTFETLFPNANEGRGFVGNFCTTAWATATQMASLIHQRGLPMASVMNQDQLRDFILAAAFWELGRTKEWPDGLVFGIIRLPGNPLWIDDRRAMYESDQATMKDIETFKAVVARDRGIQPRPGRPRGAGDFDSPEALRKEILQWMRSRAPRGQPQRSETGGFREASVG